MTYRNKLAVPAWLVATDTTTWNFKGKRFLGSGLVVLVTANRPQLSGRHYAAHQFSKFVHVVFAGDIAAQNLSQSLALDPNDGEHFKMRTFFDVDEALQVGNETVVQVRVFLAAHGQDYRFNLLQVVVHSAEGISYGEFFAKLD